MPGWVRQPLAVVSSVEDFVLWVYGETDSPSALGVWTSLTWVGDADQAKAPLTTSECAPSQNRVIAEFMLACEVSAGNDYPAPAWWAKQGFTESEIRDRGWWDAYAGWGMGRNEALGVSVALGWLFGQIDDPAHVVPAFRGDGSHIEHELRQEWALVLRGLETAPLSAPGTNRARAQARARQHDAGRGQASSA